MMDKNAFIKANFGKEVEMDGDINNGKAKFWKVLGIMDNLKVESFKESGSYLNPTVLSSRVNLKTIECMDLQLNTAKIFMKENG